MSRTRRSTRTDAASQWHAPLTVAAVGLVLFLTVSGLAILLLPFGRFPQATLLVHTIIGLIGLPLVLAYTWIHWRRRRGGNLSHYQLQGYLVAIATIACVLSGVAVTFQAIFGESANGAWNLTHLVTGLAICGLLASHLITIIVRPVSSRNAQRIGLLDARRRFWVGTGMLTSVFLIAAGAWASLHPEPSLTKSFPEEYNWRFGPDRPFTPSLARVDHKGELERLDKQIAALLAPDKRSAYRQTLTGLRDQAARTQHYTGGGLGPFGQHRRALEQAGADEEVRAQAESLIEDMAEWIRQNGALEAGAMAGSERCGDCHADIYDEWLPSAHRYAAMDDLFQQVQSLMAEETSPEHTRYCAGCHDPISLFSGAKNSGNVTLSATGFKEGISCVSCHSIVESDIQGNADYTIRLSRPYLYEYADTGPAKLAADFLIRAYPRHHVDSYSRPLYKTPEYCAACHKQYMDVDLNTDIGRVKGQNQYDSWARSRWHDEAEPDQTVHCRECHMPLQDSTDPSAGDSHDPYRHKQDGKHRSHRFLGGNQYLPLLHDLEGAEEQVALTEQWLRGEIEIPEIADKWTDGPVIRMAIDAPETIRRGDQFRFQVMLTNNKTGHDFPTGPLDMLESWLEIRVTDDLGRILHHSGGLDNRGAVVDPGIWFKADGFDRKGELIDRHNLWDLVGKSYARSIYPGMTDRVAVPLECPSITFRAMANPVTGPIDESPEGERPTRIQPVTIDLPDAGKAESIQLEAVLWYRKVNPDFMDRIYGAQAAKRAPLTEINRASTVVTIRDDG